LTEAAGPDSFNVMPALLAEKRAKPCREFLVEHVSGPAVALRQGSWKFIPGAGGAGGKGGREARSGPQLFDLSKDIGERNNLADEQPGKVAELSARLQEFKKNGRTRP
jgi:hypothetical protein